MQINKIIFFTVFICAAIMSSLFVFHLKQKPVQTTLNNDSGIIFPAAREIKPFELVSADQEKFTLENLYGHWTLMFFGFTHCAQVCPNTLGTISKAYDELRAIDPGVRVVLVSVDPERDTPESLKKYTQIFNANFIGVTGKINELRKLQSQLGIYSERESKANSGEYQIRHTPSILLINPHGQWAGLIKYGLSPEQFAQAFKESMQSLAAGRSEVLS